MAQRSKYWSCTKFADWLRGTDKLKMGTSDQWNDWHAAARLKKVRYWLAEEGLDAIQNFIWWPVDKMYDAKYYVNNRWITRTHALTSNPKDLKRGQWMDVGNRFLPCLFNELQEFVEVELAWSHIAWNDEAREKHKPPFWARGWWSVRVWRCPAAGIDNLDWQSALEDSGIPTRQAIRAREIRDLYIWWTEIYRNRLDPYEVSGWTAVVKEIEEAGDPGNRMSIFSSKIPPDLVARKNAAHNALQRIEEDYEKDEEDKLIRLIKIRDSLWT